MARLIDLTEEERKYRLTIEDNCHNNGNGSSHEYDLGDYYPDDKVEVSNEVTPKQQFDFARMIVQFSGVVFLLLMGIWFWHDWPHIKPDIFTRGLSFIEDKIYPIVLIIIGYYFGRNGPSSAKES